MKTAINIINFGPCGAARVLAELAYEAEQREQPDESGVWYTKPVETGWPNRRRPAQPALKIALRGS